VGLGTPEIARPVAARLASPHRRSTGLAAAARDQVRCGTIGQVEGRIPAMNTALAANAKNPRQQITAHCKYPLQ
jgi:hypothetical protein